MLKIIAVCLIVAATTAVMSTYTNYSLPQATPLNAAVAEAGTQKKQCIFIAWNQQKPSQGYVSADIACDSYARFRNPTDIDTIAVLADSGEEEQRL